MVLFRAQRLLSALRLVAANADSPHKFNLRERVVRCSGLLSGLLSLSIGLPGQANPVLAGINTASLPSDAAITYKGEHVDKSTLRFEQAQFEQRRLEAALLRQLRLEQVRIEHLHRLQAHLGQSAHRSAHQVVQANALPSTADDSSVNGVYLYGQQPVPDQLATAYFVFELQGGSITGAFYMPSSSFDCVQGQIEPEQIHLSVTDSYSQETSSYALSLSPPTAVVASQASPVTAPLNIAGFYQLPMNDQSQDLLAICRARYQ